LTLALGLLVAALAVDFAWVRPQEDALHRLTARKRTSERAAVLALQERSEWNALLDYVGDRADSTESWRVRYQDQDPLPLLETLRQQAGLKRFDLRLQDREPHDPFVETTYFMSVYGSFERQVAFIKALEEAAPLIVVHSFGMDQNDGTETTMKLVVSVFTQGENKS
jgi:Tfp pilus assembly protein PilO